MMQKYNTKLNVYSVLKNWWIVRLNNNTRLMALCPELPGWVGTRKVKPIWILVKQETVSGSGISCSWAIYKSAPHPRQITTPAGCPSCHPTNSIKALNAMIDKNAALNRKWNNKKLEIILTLLRQIGIPPPTVAPWREALYKDRQLNRRVGVF